MPPGHGRSPETGKVSEGKNIQTLSGQSNGYR